MRILSSLPVVFMVVLALYAFWDLGINGFQPPVAADQVAEQNPEIEEIMAVHREALKTGMSSRIVPQIDESLKLIAEEYGEVSPENNQALVDTALMLDSSTRSDLAIDYMRRAVDVSREVYGTDHRETALTLNDLANLITNVSDSDYSDESIALLSEAFAIRTNVLPADHPELVVTEVNLADQLFLQWQTEGTADDKSSLDKAANLLSHVMEVHASQGEEVNLLDKTGVQLLFARISFYRDDYENAAKYFAETLSPVAAETDPATYLIFSNSYAEHITALKKLGREEEAEQMQQDILRYIQNAESEASPVGPAKEPEAATEQQ